MKKNMSSQRLDPAMAGKKYQIVTIGTAVRDIVFYTDEGELIKNPKNDPTKLKLLCFEHGAKLKSEEVYFMFGGGAANTGINFAGLGLKTGIIVRTGDDMDGKDIMKHLQSKKVDTSLIQKDKNSRSGLSYLIVDKNTNEHVVFVYYGSNLDFKVTPAELTKFNSDWFYVSSIASESWPQTMKALCQKNCKIAWNPGSTQLKSGFKKMVNFLPSIELMILNKDEATELVLSKNPKTKKLKTQDMLEEIFTWGPGLVLISDGRSGAWVYDGVKTYFGKPTHGQPKDTTGAGDCFGSTFTAGLIKTNYNIPKSIKLAIANASSLVMKPGAQEGLLTWQQLIKRL
ncbi:carbohydrate kinase family protein [Patescibacteria group bacterium]|nr:carbohydrate kinase family protein [Patescibacteria group bacterium]